MKIEANKYYKTRDGRKVRVYATDGQRPDTIHGAILRDREWLQQKWRVDGMWIAGESQLDIIAEWVDAPDWPKGVPAWANWVAMDEDGDWLWFIDKPYARRNDWAPAWSSPADDDRYGYIPSSFATDFAGGWKDSLVERPQQ